jgi:hypothetical protein
MRRGETFPPIIVVWDGQTYYLVDGHHRLAATQELHGVDTIAATTIDGTFDDALWYSWGANRNHGLQRTRDGLHRAITAAIQHPRWGTLSARQIAHHIGCDHKTVSAMQRRLKLGKFPRQAGDQVASKPASGPPKTKILQACCLLARVKPQQESQFSGAELIALRKGCDSLYKLVYGGKTHPSGLQAEPMAEVAANAIQTSSNEAVKTGG